MYSFRAAKNPAGGDILLLNLTQSFDPLLLARFVERTPEQLKERFMEFGVSMGRAPTDDSLVTKGTGKDGYLDFGDGCKVIMTPLTTSTMLISEVINEKKGERWVRVNRMRYRKHKL